MIYRLVCLWIGISFMGGIQSAHAHQNNSNCLNPEVKLIDDSSMRATQIAPYEKWSSKQRALFESMLNRDVNQQIFESWAQEHNDQAATFLAVTFALSKTEIFLSASESVSALDMVDRLSEIHGVRLMATVDLGVFQHWVKAGGKYIVHRAGGSEERGKINFAGHAQRGGGLHCGFDIQGYTRFNKVPYLHWNVNEGDGTSDIHLDGIQPWFFGFVPNPLHLGYKNSDVRSWFNHFQKKYGNPGFKVEKSIQEE